jgi:hypothetical protein
MYRSWEADESRRNNPVPFEIGNMITRLGNYMTMACRRNGLNQAR